MSTTFDLSEINNKNTTTVFDKSTVNKYSDLFYSLRFGNGFQAFVTEDSPLKSVYTVSATSGIFYKNIVKLSFGINYRYYQAYYDYITENKTKPYFENPSWNASNIYLNLGVEVLVGHVGIDGETGVNLHKPFYKTHYQLQKTHNKSLYKLKSIFMGRLGLKLYAINTKKKPNNNFYIAAHINSNFGQADFSELSLGFTHRISKNKAMKNATWF